MTRYELLERIGAGRVAEIFRGKAVAAGGFEKPVAIKRILPRLSKDRRFVESLIAEAKILSALRHRNIVQVFDVGVGDDGQHFLVMEYVDGVDLGALQASLERRRQRVPIDLVLHVGAEVCEALDHAHVAPAPDGKPMRLVHRDVAPSNVLVSRSGEVKLTDFGLARRPDEATGAGGLRGRYGYVSPEQASGGTVDARSDVFALGIIVWELALGRRLYSGLADFDALEAVRTAPIARPRDLDPKLPAELDAILAEALAKDPRQRLPSAGELGKRLRGLRYSLDSASGDPAAALGRLVVAGAADVARHAELDEVEPAPDPRTTSARGKALSRRRSHPPGSSFEVTEPTVVRIRTADGFGSDPDGSGLLDARRLLDRFEEEETRLAHLPRPAPRGRAPATFDDGLTDPERSAMPAAGPSAEAPLYLPRDSGEITVSAPPPSGPGDARARAGGRGPRSKRGSAPAPPPPPPPSGRGPASREPGSQRGGAAPPPVPPGPPGRPAQPVLHASPGPGGPAGPGGPGGPGGGPVFGGAAAGPAPLPMPRFESSDGRGATPTTPQVYDRGGPRSSSAPPVAGFERPAARRWWPIVIGALVIATLSFLITRAALEPSGRIAADAAGAAAGAALDGAVDGAVDGGAAPNADGGAGAPPSP